MAPVKDQDLPVCGLHQEIHEENDLWQKIFIDMIQNSFEVGKDLKEVLGSVLKPILTLTKAKSGIILLQNDDCTHLVEVASKGLIKDHPVIIKKNESIEKSLLKYLPPGFECAGGSFTIINLGMRGEEIGVLALFCSELLKTDPETRKLLELLKVQISIGISRTYYHDRIKRRDLIAKASLMQLGKAMGSTLDMKKLMAQITHAAIAIVDADLCDILLLKEGSLEFQIASGYNKIYKGFGDVSLKDDPAFGIVKRGRGMIIRNIRYNSRFNERPWIRNEQFKSYIGVPIKQGDHVIGVLEVFAKSPSKFSYSDQKILQSLAGPMAASLQNVGYLAETKRKADELKILHNHITRILPERDIGKMMKEIVEAARSAVGSLMAAAALYNSDTGRFEYRTTNIDPRLGQRDLAQDQKKNVSYAEDVYAEILRTGKLIRLDDIKLHRSSVNKLYSDQPQRGFMGVPLMDQNKVPCGVVMVSFKKDGGLFTEADEEILTTLANQASIAIQNAYLYQQLEYRAKALKSLLSISQKINSSHNSKKVLEFVIEAVSNFFGARSVCVALYNEVDGELQITKCLIDGVEHVSNKKLIIDEDKRTKLFRDKRPVMILSTLEDELRGQNESIKDAIKTFLEIPLVVQNKVIGALGISTSWTDKSQIENEKELLQIFANQVAIAIDNSRLYEEALSKAGNLATMLEVSKVVTSEIDLTPIFKKIALFIKKMFAVKHGWIFLSDRVGEKLELSHKWGTMATTKMPKNINTSDDDCAVAKSFRDRALIIIDNLQENSPWGRRDCKLDEDLKSAVIIPLIVKGEACGAMALFSKELSFFNEERLSIISIFANQSAIAIRNNQLYAKAIEQEVARREAELSVELLEEKVKSSTVIEKTTEGVFMVDSDQKIILYNPALEELTGRDAERVVGKRCWETFRDIFIDGILCEKCPLDNNNSKSVERLRTVIKHKSGELRHVEINISAIDHGTKKGIIGWIRDVTKELELEIYQHDLRIATDVQKNILPRSRPMIKGLDVGFLCKPAKQIGGDYFDFIPLGNDRLGIAVGDVAGKGLPAALLVSMHKYILRSATANTDSVISPLRALNQILWEDTSPEVFVTTIYGVYNRMTSTFIYANAGHLPPLLYAKGKTKYLWSPQIPLGIQQELFIEQHQVRLKTGDILVLLSDGVTDTMNSKRECFGLDRLKRLVKKHSELNGQQIADMIYKQTIEFSTGELNDDFTIVVLKCTDDGRDEKSVREIVIANKPVAVNDVRKFISRELKHAKLSIGDTGDILVAACEAVTNCVLHGQSPDGENNDIRVKCISKNDLFRVEISDNGIGYNPNLLEWRPPDLVRDRGRGIFLMQNLMDKVEFLVGDRGTTVVLEKALPTSES